MFVKDQQCILVIPEKKDYIISFGRINGQISEVIKNREFVADCVIEHCIEISTNKIDNVFIATDGLRFFPKKEMRFSKKSINRDFSLMDNIISDYKIDLRDDLGIVIINRKNNGDLK